MAKFFLFKKQTFVILFILFPFFSRAQCSISFDELVKALNNNEADLKRQISYKGYVFKSKENTFFCGESYLFRKYYEDGAVGLDYMMPNSSYEIQKIINSAKYYGMKLIDSKTNPSTGLPINIYYGGTGNLMMQISGNEQYNHVTLFGK